MDHFVFLIFFSLLLVAAFPFLSRTFGDSATPRSFFRSIWLLVASGAINIAGACYGKIYGQGVLETIALMKNPTPGDVAVAQYEAQKVLMILEIASALIFLLAIVLFVLDLSKLSSSQAMASHERLTVPEELDPQ